MNILFVTAENIFGTGSSNIRNVSLIDGLANCGHSVEILTFKVDRNCKKYDDAIEEKLKKYKIHFLSNNSLQKLFTLKKHKNNEKDKLLKLLFYRIIKRTYLYFSITDTLSAAVRSVDFEEMPNGTYDVIISSSDPVSSHLLARKFINLHNLDTIWYQYWGDPLFYDITRTNKNKKASKRLEHRLLLQCDKIVYTNGLVLEEQKKLYNDVADKMSYIPTPFAFFKEKNMQITDETYDIGYFGSYMSSIRDIQPLINVANSFKKKLIVMGGGDQNINESNNVLTKPFQGISEVCKYENMCKVLVCICNRPKDGMCVQIPGKAYHYAITDKPILIIGATYQVQEYLNQYNRFHFAANTVEDIWNKLSLIYEGKEKNKNSALVDFLPEKVARKFIT